jgi:hypothetical protein
MARRRPNSQPERLPYLSLNLVAADVRRLVLLATKKVSDTLTAESVDGRADFTTISP